MQFEWDEKKNEKNRQKHGVWFEEAKNIAIGYSGYERLLVTAFCYRKNESVIRIISVRKATKKERRFYEERI